MFAKRCLVGTLIACQLFPSLTFAHSDIQVASILQDLGQATTEGQEGVQRWVGAQMSSQINQHLHNWVAPLGSVKSNIAFDEQLQLRTAEIDLLLPVYDKQGHFLYSQVGVNKSPHRFTSSLGVGYRHFFEHNMLGVNAFYDVQWQQQHERFGLGIEWWRDNLKLSANGYFRLSDWQESPTLTDYDERPANGWDVNIEGWLPTYPQLGGKLTFEQYYGDNVTLFGDTTHQKNPFAMTAGLSYTPMPLLTAGVDYRIGEQGHHDTRFTLGMNYQFGVPWSQQINTDAVSRSMALRRYDMVNRNNEMVLEVKKQTLITLSMPATLSGQVEQTVTLTPTVNAKYGLSHFVVDDRALRQAGGRIHQNANGRITIQFPTSTTPVSLGVTAYDKRGNSSTVEYIQLLPLAASATHLTLTLSQQQTPALENRPITATLQATDNAGKPLAGQSVRWESHLGTLEGQSQTDEHGRATATLYSTIAGQTQIVAYVKSQRIHSETVTFTPVQYATLLADKNAAHADGQDAVTYSLTVRDGQGVPVVNSPVQWFTTLGELSATMNHTNAQGVATVMLRSKQAGDAIVRAVHEDKQLTANAVRFASVITGQIAVNKTQGLANGHDGITYTVTLRNSAGLPQAGIPIVWQTSLGAFNSQDAVTNASGAASATLSSAHYGQANVIVQAGKETLRAPEVRFTPAFTAILTPSRTKAPADGSTEVCYRASIKDAAGEPYNGVTHWQTTLGTFTKRDDRATNGEAIACLSSVQDGEALVTLQGDGFTQQAPRVSFNVVLQGALTVTAPAYPNVPLPITLTLRDATGKPVAGEVVTWHGDNAQFSPVTGKTDAQGKLQTYVTLSASGANKISAAFAGQEVSHTIETRPALQLTRIIGVRADGSDGRNFGERVPTFLWPGAQLRLKTDNHVNNVVWSSSNDAVTVHGDTLHIHRRPENTVITGRDDAGQRITLRLNSHWFTQALTDYFPMSKAVEQCKAKNSNIASLYVLRALIADWGADLPTYPEWNKSTRIATGTTQVGDSATGDFVHRWHLIFESDGSVLEQLFSFSAQYDAGWFACY